MTEKVELKVNFKNLNGVISLLKKKYNIIGGSWTGKSEPIALKLAKFCVRVDDNLKQKSDIISLLDEYSNDELNRRHTLIGISSSDLLILLFNEDMELSIKDNRLIAIYDEKTLITTRNLHGLLSEDISLNSQDNIKFEVKMTVDIRSCKKVSFKDNSSDYIIQQLSSGSVNQEDNPSDDIIQESNSSDDIIQQLSSGSVNQEDNSSDYIIQQLSSGSVKQEDNSNDYIIQESNSSDNVIEQTGSSDDIIQKDNSSNNDVGNSVENTVDDKDDNVDNDVKDILKILVKRLIVKLLMERLEY